MTFWNVARGRHNLMCDDNNNKINEINWKWKNERNVWLTLAIANSIALRQ